MKMMKSRLYSRDIFGVATTRDLSVGNAASAAKSLFRVTSRLICGQPNNP